MTSLSCAAYFNGVDMPELVAAFFAEAAIGEGAAAAGAGLSASAAGAGFAGAGGVAAGLEGAAGAGLLEGAAGVTGLSGSLAASGFGAGAAAGAGAGLTLGGMLDTAKSVSTVLSPVASIYGAMAGISASKSLGRLTPTVPASTPMPIYGSPATSASQQASLMSQALRRGRASTILTAPDGERLGQ